MLMVVAVFVIVGVDPHAYYIQAVKLMEDFESVLHVSVLASGTNAAYA